MLAFLELMTIKMFIISGVDPGFSVGGGADPGEGMSTDDFVKYSKKLHQIENILGCTRWGCPT